MATHLSECWPYTGPIVEVGRCFISGCSFVNYGIWKTTFPWMRRTNCLWFSLKAWVLPYCPEQAPMGTRSSSVKIWGWAVTRRTCLNGSIILMKGPTPDAKLAAMGLNGLASSVRQLFVEAGTDSVESCIVLQSGATCSLVAKFPQHSVVPCSTRISCCRRRTLQTRHGWVCANLWCLISCHSGTYAGSDSLRKI